MIAHFSLRLICGISLMWCLMPRREVTVGFFRIQMLVALGLSVLAGLTFGEFSPGGQEQTPRLSESASVALCWVLAGAAFLGSIVWTLGRRRAGDVFVYLIAVVSAGVLLFSQHPLGPIGSAVETLRMGSDLSSAALLGGATTGMLLGHWYLTAPTMSIAPLSRLNVYFGAAALVRLVLSAAGLAMAWNRIDGSTETMWMALRWTAGIAGPLVLCVMVWRILKYRNTQAATGVLFVGVILTFIGETTGLLLFRELAIPV